MTPGEKGLAQRYADMTSYAVALARSIEYHSRGKNVPVWVAEFCPHHAEMLNNALARELSAQEKTE